MKLEHTRTLVITPDWMDASVVKDSEHGGDALHVKSEEWHIRGPNKYGDVLAEPIIAHCDIDQEDCEPANIELIVRNPSCTDDECMLEPINIFPLMSENMQALIAEELGQDYARIIREAAEARAEDGI